MVKSGAAIASVTLVAAVGWAAQRPRVEIIASGPAAGDGKTPITLSVRVNPAAPARSVQVVRVEADAGTVGPVMTLADHLEAQFVPPNTAADRVVEVRAVLLVKNQQVNAELAIKVVAPHHTAANRQSGLALKLEGPQAMVLGRDRLAVLSYDTPPHDTPTVLANVGSVSPVTLTADGRQSVTYTPPAERYPQMAIITVAGTNGQVLDWLAIPLYGQAEVETETDPKATVTVQVATERFGPVRADNRGRARLEVIVPPGTTEAAASGIDALGNAKEEQIRLEAPPYSRLKALCSPGGDVFRFIAVEPDGRGMVGVKLDLKASRGSLNPPAMITPGVYEALLGLPADVREGDKVQLTAAIEGEPASSASCAVTVQSAPPAKVTLRVDPQVFVAGSGVTIAVSGEAVDAAGRPAKVSSVELVTDFGEVKETRAIGAGQFRGLWVLPAVLRDRHSAHATAHAGTVSAEASVELRPGRATHLTAHADDAALRADGHSETRIEVQGEDAYGNACSSARLKATGQGQISTFTFDEARGTYSARYTAPVSTQPGEDAVIIRDEAADVQTTLSLSLKPVHRALAIGIKAGYAANFAKISAPVVGADVAFRLPGLHDFFSVGFETAYLTTSNKSLSADHVESVTTTMWQMPFLGQLTFAMTFDSFGVYGGISGGAALVFRSNSSQSSGRFAETRVQPAVGGRVGVDCALGPGALALEASYLYSQLASGVVQGNVGGLRTALAYRFAL
jgi:hypothetical protein